jgi:uncharacterized protein (DUF1015 family)
VPEIRPFRALRYQLDVVGDPGAVVAPPYDVVDPERQRILLARHPKNAVRLDLPATEAGEDPDERYRRAARTLAAWRSDGTLRKDPRPSIYVYEQTFRVPGSDEERTQRGFFGILKLEPLGDGVLPHERTMTGPKEDRYRLLRATGINTSPIVALYEDPGGSAATALAAAATASPAVDVTDDDGVRHRLWVVPDGADEAGGPASLLRAAAGRAPVVIADGHHRYETALRYRDERRMTRSCEEDPAFDYALVLFLAAGEPLTVLPTHRLIRDLPDDGAGLLDALRAWFDVTPATAGALIARFGSPTAGGAGRFGVWTRHGGASATIRPDVLAVLAGGGSSAAGRLDVALLGATLERVAGIDAEAMTGGQRVAFTKSATDAIAAVDARRDGTDAAFLLESTPVAAILEVARAGEVMPQKSTYFYPKALTGLVLNPHEW